MKILLTGSNGQVGWELQRTLAPLGEVLAPSREELDLSRPETLRKTILSLKPRWIVNSGAYTSVDKAEHERDLAFTVNAEAPRILAETCAEVGAALIHYSTDYVFEGISSTPFDEEAPIKPLNVYGASKAAGEAKIRIALSEHFIFRTSWIYGQRGKNFFLTMKQLMSEQNELRVINDQIGAPTWCRHVAEATALIITQASCSHIFEPSQFWGTYHMTNGGETSWFGFAEEISKRMGLEKTPHLVTISSREYPLPALRPLNSRLSNAKLEKVFKIRLPDWRVAFNQMIGK